MINQCLKRQNVSLTTSDTLKKIKQILMTRTLLQLSPGDIHLWITRPKQHHQPELLQRFRLLMNEEELIKQQRYRFEKDRHDALVTRAFVRDLLSQYAGVKPEEWRFSRGEKDKPEIVDAPLPLRFNISHTREMIICAVTLEHDIGCDVEYLERNNDILNIADRYFSSLEVMELFSLPEPLQRSRFFDYWTLKESYIKAWGLGLAIPLRDFSFHIGQGVGQGENRVINPDIRLSFAPHRIDYPELWHSWLFYPNATHRMALSIRTKTAREKKDFTVRFFESTPLLGYNEINLPL